MTAAADAPPPGHADCWRPWADLPLDLLRDISRCLHAAADYVRFHAVCVPWRDALPPPRSRPAFLPWLVAPPDASGRLKGRCVFVSSRSSSRCGSGATPANSEIAFRDRRWVIGVEDGVATTLPPYLTNEGGRWRSWWVDHNAGTVSGDGTIFLHGYRPFFYCMAILHPGDSYWTVVWPRGLTSSSSCVAYSDGKIVTCDWLYMESWCTMTGHVDDLSLTGDDHRQKWSLPMPSQQDDKAVQSCHLMEFRGELLLACVLLDHEHYFYHRYKYPYHRCALDKDYYSVGNFAAGLLVSVYALEDGEDGNNPQWVKKDGWSIADCVMFLGRPSSFAVDAARFGMSSGAGCAYFVVKSELYGEISSKSALERCRVFKYTFHDGKSEIVKVLPAEWEDGACMWLTPQPSSPISSTEEIRARLESSYRKAAQLRLGPYFRIYVGNLPWKVDSYQLHQFFSKHGKVADARVICHVDTKRSRGFGFVTLATAVDDEPAQAIAKLDGQMLDGRPMRVKFADFRSKW